MRFIRREQVTTTICNEDVTEEDVVKSVLENLKSNRIEFSLTVKKYFDSMNDFREMQYSKVRVKDVEDAEADFIVFDRSATTHLKEVHFSDIVQIKALTTADKILSTKLDLTRWDFLDIQEED